MRLTSAVSITWLALFFVPAPAPGSELSRYRGHGFVYFGIDGPRSDFGQLLSLGGGGEAFIYKGLGAGADLAWLFPRQSFTEGVGLLSVNPSYHFVNRMEPRKFVPFATGGYGLAFRGGHINLYNYGGGATYWISDQLGLRFEVRDYRHTQYGQFSLTVRFALAVR